MLDELSSVLEERASTRSLIACNEIAIDFKARAVSSTATICSPRPLESAFTFSPMTSSTSSISLWIARICESTSSTSIDSGSPEAMINRPSTPSTAATTPAMEAPWAPANAPDATPTGPTTNASAKHKKPGTR